MPRVLTLTPRRVRALALLALVGAVTAMHCGPVGRAAMLSVFVAGGAGRSDQTLPTSLPSARSLLAQAQAVDARANGVHVENFDRRVVPKRQVELERQVGDISPRRGQSRYAVATRVITLTGSRPRVSTSRSTVLFTRSWLASYSPQRGWVCPRSSTTTTTRHVLSGRTGSKSSVATVGLTLQGGVVAWDVVMTNTARFHGSTARSVVDVYVAKRSHHTLRQRVFRTTTSPGATVYETSVTTYSRYGEAVHVTLPRACAHGRVARAYD